MKEIVQALKPYGCEWLVSVTTIAGPGNLIVVFASAGDFHVACLNHRREVLWAMTCGSAEIDSNVEGINLLHRASREFYLLDPSVDHLVVVPASAAFPSEDTVRLNYLDLRNQRKNERTGSNYGWKLEENHNRIALSDHNLPKLTVRQAIDEARSRK